MHGRLLSVEEIERNPSRSRPFPSGGGGERILIVDDDPGVLRVIVRVLEGAGYQAYPEACSEDALRRVPALAPRLVLCDVEMSGMGGPELAQRVRVRMPDVAVVFMTGGRALDPSERDIGRGVPEPLLKKPISSPELLRAVRGALDPRGT